MMLTRDELIRKLEDGKKLMGFYAANLDSVQNDAPEVLALEQYGYWIISLQSNNIENLKTMLVNKEFTKSIKQLIKNNDDFSFKKISETTSFPKNRFLNDLCYLACYVWQTDLKMEKVVMTQPSALTVLFPSIEHEGALTPETLRELLKTNVVCEETKKLRSLQLLTFEPDKFQKEWQKLSVQQRNALVDYSPLTKEICDTFDKLKNADDELKDSNNKLQNTASSKKTSLSLFEALENLADAYEQNEQFLEGKEELKKSVDNFRDYYNIYSNQQKNTDNENTLINTNRFLAHSGLSAGALLDLVDQILTDDINVHRDDNKDESEDSSMSSVSWKDIESSYIRQVLQDSANLFAEYGDKTLLNFFLYRRAELDSKQLKFELERQQKKLKDLINLEQVIYLINSDQEIQALNVFLNLFDSIEGIKYLPLLINAINSVEKAKQFFEILLTKLQEMPAQKIFSETLILYSLGYIFKKIELGSYEQEFCSVINLKKKFTEDELNTALVQAAFHGSDTAINFIINYAQELPTPNILMSMIMATIATGDAKTLKAILAIKNELNNDKNFTPLYYSLAIGAWIDFYRYAALNNKPEIIKILNDLDIINNFDEITGSESYINSQAICSNNDLDLIKDFHGTRSKMRSDYLKPKYWEDIFNVAAQQNSLEAFKYLDSIFIMPNGFNWYTSYYIALQKGYSELSDYLFAKKNLDLSQTAWSSFGRQAVVEGYSKTLASIIDNISKKNINFDYSDEDWWALLSMAANNEYTDILKQLTTYINTNKIKIVIPMASKRQLYINAILNRNADILNELDRNRNFPLSSSTASAFSNEVWLEIYACALENFNREVLEHIENRNAYQSISKEAWLLLSKNAVAKNNAQALIFIFDKIQQKKDLSILEENMLGEIEPGFSENEICELYRRAVEYESSNVLKLLTEYIHTNKIKLIFTTGDWFKFYLHTVSKEYADVFKPLVEQFPSSSSSSSSFTKDNWVAIYEVAIKNYQLPTLKYLDILKVSQSLSSNDWLNLAKTAKVANNKEAFEFILDKIRVKEQQEVMKTDNVRLLDENEHLSEFSKSNNTGTKQFKDVIEEEKEAQEVLFVQKMGDGSDKSNKSNEPDKKHAFFNSGITLFKESQSKISALNSNLSNEKMPYSHSADDKGYNSVDDKGYDSADDQDPHKIPKPNF